jgi:hypothetical protein
MEDFSIEKPKIAKLTGLNYRPWSVQVRRLLVAQGLWDVVSQGLQGLKEPETGGPAAPEGSKDTREEPKAPAPTVALDLKADAKASTIIMGLCNQDTLQHILLLETAQEQWDALKALYQPLGRQQLGAKIQAFTAYIPPKDRASVTTVATELSTLQAEIGDIDPQERPSENAKIAVFLRAIRALDPRFDPLILQLEISDLATNYSVVVTKFTEFERRMGPKESIKEGAYSAMDAKGKLKFKGKCYNCGKTGHRVRDCRAPKKDPEDAGKSPSTGPLPTPTGGRGLSPSPAKAGAIGSTANAKYAVEQSWAAFTVDNRASGSLGSLDELLWVVDSGASRHMTYCRDAFTEFSALQEPIVIQTANGAELQAVGQGTVVLKVPRKGAVSPVALTEVLYVPGLAGSLISVVQLQDKGITVRTTGDKGLKRLLIERQGRVLGEAERLGKAYTLKGVTMGPERALAASTDAEARLLHRRLGHLSSGSLQHIEAVTTGLQGPVKALEEPCEPCTLAKTVRVVNRESPERVTALLARLHTDFWGPYSVLSLYGSLYFVSFTDEATRKTWVFFTKDRASIRTIFIELKARVELETGLKILVVRCDNAPEYRALADFYRPYGLRFEFTTPYFHQQNGVPERLNRTLVTVARAMLQDAGLPEKFWQDAVETACYIRNRVPIGPNGVTPEEAYSGKKPYIGHLKAWGCLAYPYIPLEQRRKLQPTAGKACFIGYMPTSRQYKLYDPITKRIIVSTAPTFREDKRLQYNWDEELPGEVVTIFDPWEAPESDAIEPESPAAIGAPEPENVRATGPDLAVSGHAELEAEAPEESTIGDLPPVGTESPEEPEIGAAEPRRSARARAPPERYIDQAMAAIAGPVGLEQPKIPKTEAEALADPLWKEAISEELTKLQALGTWEYAELPTGRKAVGCKWVFTVKYTPTGLIDRYKARLVAQGFSQLPGDDYLETFSPTIRAESLRTLLALGALEDLEIRQVDVVSAYPRAQLHATVYMKPPRALEAPEGSVLLLGRPLYGLKQSGREWYLEACRGLETLGFRPCFSDPSVFVTEDRSQIIGLYVDDMLIFGRSLQAVDATVQGIKALWEIKDLGDVSLILGLKIVRDRASKTLKINQTHYIQSLMERFRLQNANSIGLPVGDRNALVQGASSEPQADQALYQQAIGALMWLAKGSRPDIMYAVGQLSQHCNCPTIRHWNSALRVLRYLKGTEDYCVQYGPIGPEGAGAGDLKSPVSPKLQGYCDADYAGDTVDRRSVTGHLFTMNRGPVSWTSTKQRCVATSTTESEYIALSEACKQGQWLRALLRELQRTKLLGEGLAMPIYSDNQACIALAKDPVAHSRTKHIDVRYHYIRELVVGGKTTVDYCPTADMTADILTKPLSLQGFQRCRQKLLSL